MYYILWKQGWEHFCFDKCCIFYLKNYLHKYSSDIEGCATIGNFCHKTLELICVPRGLADSTVTTFSLCAGMCTGWAERGIVVCSQEGRAGSMRVGLRAAGDKSAPARSHWWYNTALHWDPDEFPMLDTALVRFLEESREEMSTWQKSLWAEVSKHAASFWVTR